MILILKCIFTSPSFYGDPFHKLRRIVKNKPKPINNKGMKVLSEDN